VDEPIEVAQKINPAPIIHRLIDALNIAPTRFKAALIVARIHAALAPLRKADAEFDEEWSQLLGGHFIEIVSSPDAWLDLEWRHIWQAQEILGDLMERHGMGFQALQPDALEEEIAVILPELGEFIRRSRAAERATQVRKKVEP
jgi:hypothetical protein